MATPTWMQIETALTNQAVGTTFYGPVEVIKLENGNVDVPAIGIQNETPTESARKIKTEILLRSTLP